ncbi:MAG: glycosyltransferase [Gemmatimonadetes bacterium]|nr:glycosyltransferase [Gemmatimonadota bacterium]
MPGLSVVLAAKFNDSYHRVGHGLAAGLAGLGCRVRRVDLRTKPWQRWLGADLGARLRRAAAGADLILSYKAAELTPAVIANVRPATRARWVNWFPDSPHLLDTALANSAGYDHCFLFDSYLVGRLRAAGRRADFLPLGFDPEFYTPVPVSGPPIPIVFVGSAEPLRDAALAKLDGLGLEVWGPGRPRGPLFGKRLVTTYCRAEIALNIHQFFGEPADLGRYGTGANQRVFELAGIGAPQLCDAKADIAASFEEDREIVLFRTPDELREKALRLLADHQWRARLAAGARARAVAQHTWQHRLAELFERVFG